MHGTGTSLASGLQPMQVTIHVRGLIQAEGTMMVGTWPLELNTSPTVVTGTSRLSLSVLIAQMSESMFNYEEPAWLRETTTYASGPWYPASWLREFVRGNPTRNYLNLRPRYCGWPKSFKARRSSTPRSSRQLMAVGRQRSINKRKAFLVALRNST